jgi:hypothetical protein
VLFCVDTRHQQHVTGTLGTKSTKNVLSLSLRSFCAPADQKPAKLVSGQPPRKKVAKNRPLLAAILVSGCGFWLVYSAGGGSF